MEAAGHNPEIGLEELVFSRNGAPFATVQETKRASDPKTALPAAVAQASERAYHFDFETPESYAAFQKAFVLRPGPAMIWLQRGEGPSVSEVWRAEQEYLPGMVRVKLFKEEPPKGIRLPAREMAAWSLPGRTWRGDWEFRLRVRFQFTASVASNQSAALYLCFDGLYGASGLSSCNFRHDAVRKSLTAHLSYAKDIKDVSKPIGHIPWDRMGPIYQASGLYDLTWTRRGARLSLSTPQEELYTVEIPADLMTRMDENPVRMSFTSTTPEYTLLDFDDWYFGPPTQSTPAHTSTDAGK